ncbi:rod shape-determining protein MreD [Butyrivibrio sp. YAB3001]|uniref:rod shape-determining protein MreD n=1 Tax=Butyrivibrio sp. YAB3001 TaxID=1520812 RepID=UPI0008F6335D|nr:rod shape-determining protein MreD [Butyrivibrio sp. YAB3001]SFB67889.1 rod shape-determining protein MreD [Butyrivibrio sp. YAB3001]
MNIRRAITNFILLLVSFILQTTVFRRIDFGGITPNLLLIVVVSSAFIKGDKTGLLVGFFSGILVDIFFGSYLGFFALIYMYLGFIVGKFHEVFFSQNIAIPIFFITITDFVYGFICYVLMFLFRTRFNIGYYMMSVIVPEMVYTALIAIFYYPVILYLNNKIDEREQRSAKKFV